MSHILTFQKPGMNFDRRIAVEQESERIRDRC